MGHRDEFEESATCMWSGLCKDILVAQTEREEARMWARKYRARSRRMRRERDALMDALDDKGFRVHRVAGGFLVEEKLHRWVD